MFIKPRQHYTSLEFFLSRHVNSVKVNFGKKKKKSEHAEYLNLS